MTLQIPAHADSKAWALTVRHLVEKAGARLRGLEMAEDGSGLLLERARSLAEDPGLAAVRSGTAAVYATRSYAKAVLWPAELPQRVEVGIDFHLSDAIDLLDPADCYLLTVSLGGVALYRADVMSLEPMELVGVPASLAAATEHLDIERQSQLHPAQAGGLGGGGAIHHGIGVGEGRDVEELRNYLRAVDHGVRSAIADAPAPVALVGPADTASEFRAITHMDQLVDQVAWTNPEAVGTVELREFADETLATARAATVTEARQHIGDLAASSKASFDVAEVVEAAAAGRVDTLLLGSRQGGSDEVQERRVNRAAVATLRHKGRVMVDGSLDAVVAASLRY